MSTATKSRSRQLPTTRRTSSSTPTTTATTRTTTVSRSTGTTSCATTGGRVVPSSAQPAQRSVTSVLTPQRRTASTWNLSHVANQDNVRFKIRVVDTAGNVVEAPGGASAPFTLTRSYSVEVYTSDDFSDAGLYFQNTLPRHHEATIELPADLAGVERAILLGNYWQSPNICDQRATHRSSTYRNKQDDWQTMRKEHRSRRCSAGCQHHRLELRATGLRCDGRRAGADDRRAPPGTLGSGAYHSPARRRRRPGLGEAVTFTVGATGSRHAGFAVAAQRHTDPRCQRPDRTRLRR